MSKGDFGLSITLRILFLQVNTLHSSQVEMSSMRQQKKRDETEIELKEK